MNTTHRLPGLLFVLVILPLALAGAGCDIDDLTDGCWDDDCPEITRTYELDGFDAIQVEDALRLTVRQGDNFGVRVTVPERLEDDIEVSRDGNRLHIALDEGGGCGERRVEIEMPLLRALEAQEASRVVLRGLSTPGTLELDLSGASRVEGDVSVAATVVHLSGASEAELSGTTERLELNASEVSRARLLDLSARSADVQLHSVSSGWVTVSERLDVAASGASVLRYAGDPELGRVDLSEGSRLERER
jgi:hypothetical protein